jgi:hypothetical protein
MSKKRGIKRAYGHQKQYSPSWNVNSLSESQIFNSVSFIIDTSLCTVFYYYQPKKHIYLLSLWIIRKKPSVIIIKRNSLISDA